MLLQLPNTFRAFYGSFPRLHTAQKEAVAPILDGRDLVLQAATGSGKSEAVLAPCLERVIQSGRKRAVLYIIPTRALAMDLKRRFESIIKERLGLNLAIRTGDIKLAGGKSPDIMLTTPESLDVMLGSTNADLKAFLFRVETIIIDEVHSFIHQYRGRHLVHLFTRLERRTGRSLQKIAMSATISRAGSVIDFFGFHPSSKSIITSVRRKIKARLLHIKQEKTEIPALLNDLYDTWKYRKILIFVNSRVACDRVFGIVNRTGRFKGVSELHYSNLKPLERKRAEKRFRIRPHALCIATSTLELGIDVGDVDAVILYQPPGSVAAFLQRVGRANRRGNEINFWGLCCGERSGDQLVRFLAFLELSGRGIVESHNTRALPSVLSQQVISCLYEKKRVTLSSLQSLFPDQHESLPSLFDSLEKKHWLKPSGIHGLFGGGWQYRNHLLDYKIWGNFPEAEVDYILEVSGKAIADIPQSIVSQLEVGDRIYLAGRLIRILNIDTSDHKKVLARPSKGKEDKQLAWIGLGPPVSHEVAQAMGQILSTGEVEDKTCLLARTRKLFQKELGLGTKGVVLENGIEVVPGKTAPFRYRTFMGSMGNLMLEWSIRESLKEDDMVISSDEIGVECSHWIKIETLNLPVDRDGFQIWVKRHFKILASLVPLNLFCKALPREQLMEELTDFLFDYRVARTFAHYLNSSSKVILGDMATLLLGMPVQENLDPCAIDIRVGESLLAREKEKNRTEGKENRSYSICSDRCRYPSLSPDSKVILTATMVSDYFFHAQCQRRFCLKSLGIEPLAHDTLEPDGFRQNSMDRGIFHEQEVLKHLKESGAAIISMETTGNKESRFNAVLEQVKALVSSLMETAISHDKAPVLLSQCLLKVDILGQESFHMKGIGVPDLMALSLKEVNGKKTAVIEVGDIKSSLSPGYHHKWQVAFYAWLLESIITSHGIPAMVAETGFIITCASGRNILTGKIGSSEKNISFGQNREKGGQFQDLLFQDLLFQESFLYRTHRFNLKAYLAAVPVLLKTFHTCLVNPAALADHRLHNHCVSCDWFFSCYKDALEFEDIQFLPGVTAGELLKLRQMGCSTMDKLHETLEKSSSHNNQDNDNKNNDNQEISEGIMESAFSPEQEKDLLGRCTAFLENKILLAKKNTRLFPDNISRAFFIDVKKDPLTGLPVYLGYQVVEASGTMIDSRVWIMEEDQDQRSAWREFVTRISMLWEKSILDGKGPHIFHFGYSSRQDLLDWGESEQGEKPLFLWQTRSNPGPSHWTDLRRVFTAHFYLPAPGSVSLFTLAYLFGYPLELKPPQTLFHSQGTDIVNLSELDSSVSATLSTMADLYAKARLYIKSQWVQEWEISTQTDKSSGVMPYLGFIKEELRLQEENILTLQELTLQERMVRFRAIGHLRFDYTRLDHEGRFLYLFNSSIKTCTSKFRPGDFLRLAFHGIPDIQTGFPVILAEYDMAAGRLSLLSRSGKLSLSKHLMYSLEEDTSDWNQEKLIHVVTALFKGGRPHFLHQLLSGEALERQSSDSLPWLEKWLASNDHGLNPSQQRALALPFQYRTSLIQGPPGTGKTHLLGWMLIALIMQAHEARQPLRIGVSALTHQAIDTVLKKVTKLVNLYLPDLFPGRCIKWGQASHSREMDGDKETSSGITMEFSDDANEVLDHPWLILGATGYGLYKLFNSKDKGFPQALDWVVFDEASQVPLPQALLSLIYSRGNFIFLGDVKQLPPIVLGNYGDDPGEPVDSSFNRSNMALNRSILANFLDIYPEKHQETLDTTYRMNNEICAFPGKTWYKSLLHPASSNANARLILKNPLSRICDDTGSRYPCNRILDPAKPVVLVVMDHQGCSQQSEMEADLMASLAHRLMVSHGVSPDQMALISPHRAQNNAILKKLGGLMGDLPGDLIGNPGLPAVDTVERVQGAERDIIIFGITSSDPDHLLSEFLNSPNRLNVAMTRAKTKLIVVGSGAFFSVIPDSEIMLEKNACFKALMHHCQEQDAVFRIP